MPTLDVFKADAFTMTSLTAVVNALKAKPGRLGELGIFEDVPVSTVTAQIDEDNGILSLVSTQARGGPASVAKAGRPRAIPFNIPHIPYTDVILANDIQGIRKLGSDNEVEAVQEVVARRLAAMRQSIEATVEYHRCGAIQGVVKDADGSTTIHSMFTKFDHSEQTLAWALGTATTDVRKKCSEARRKAEDALGANAYSRLVGIAGSDFWDKLINHDYVKDAYSRWESGAMLRDDPRGGFLFGGITWYEYTGKIGNVDFFPDDESRVFPIGVPGLFQTVYGPGNFIDAVGTLGQPVYARQEPMKFDRGVELLVESNPLCICTMPRTLVKGTTN